MTLDGIFVLFLPLLLFLSTIMTVNRYDYRPSHLLSSKYAVLNSKIIKKFQEYRNFTFNLCFARTNVYMLTILYT
jgi:hypothetical protein